MHPSYTAEEYALLQDQDSAERKFHDDVQGMMPFLELMEAVGMPVIIQWLTDEELEKLLAGSVHAMKDKRVGALVPSATDSKIPLPGQTLLQRNNKSCTKASLTEAKEQKQ